MAVRFFLVSTLALSLAAPVAARESLLAGRDPAAVLEETAASLGRQREALLSTASGRVAQGVATILGRAQAALASGRPCDAAIAWDEAVRGLQTIDRELSREAGFPRATREDVRREWADWSEAEEAALALARRRRAIAAVAVDLAGSRALFGEVCATRRKATHEGIVTEYEPGLGSITLDGERTFRIVAGTDTSRQLFAGRRARVTFVTLAAGYGYAEQIAVVDRVPGWTDFGGQPTPGCLAFKVAPAQPFAPDFQGPYLLHPPAGYRIFPPGSSPGHEGTLAFEVGARFGVHDEGCVKVGKTTPGPVPIVESFRYGVMLEATFTEIGTGKTIEKWLLAADLKHGAHPVRLPRSAASVQIAKLFVTWHVQRCKNDGTPLPPTCGAKEVLQERRYDLIVRPRGTFCDAVFSETSFDLESAGSDEFRLASVSATTTPWLDAHIQTKTFKAKSGSSTVGLGDEFRVYRKHIYSGDFALPGDNESLTGARIEGIGGGGPFRFTCALPRLVGDLLHRCDGGQPDTYYKLPFEGPMPWWGMGQGNNGDFTHKGAAAYAFDFLEDEGTEILAARSGWVEGIREDVWWNCLALPAMPCDANWVYVRHQDDSVARYIHMPLNGVSVVDGAYVQRGQPIGVVGNTGKSTEPHLHFEVREGASSIPISFERYFTYDMENVYPCNIPKKGEALPSTNG